MTTREVDVVRAATRPRRRRLLAYKTPCESALLVCDHNADTGDAVGAIEPDAVHPSGPFIKRIVFGPDHNHVIEHMHDMALAKVKARAVVDLFNAVKRGFLWIVANASGRSQSGHTEFGV